MKDVRIAFTSGHNESILPDTSKNFLKLISFFTKITENIEVLEEDSDFSEYSLIIAGSPEKAYSENYTEKLRAYIKNGGKFLFLTKYGKYDLNTNINELFPEIRVNKDVVCCNDNHFMDFPHKPFVKIKSDEFNFNEEIIYDAGCTINLACEPDYVVYLNKDNYYTIPNPRLIGTRFKGIKQSFNDREKAILVYKKFDKGAVVYFGSRWSFSDERFNQNENSTLLRKIIELLMDIEYYNLDVETRMNKVQRHRLLHGFPMPDASVEVDNFYIKNINELDIDFNKKIALGIIPHPMCNPKIKACGYCPFPHENYNQERMEKSVLSVIKELNSITDNFKFNQREISSIYFGGGTATLTDNVLFEKLCDSILENLKITKETEITLEGTPYDFVNNKVLLKTLKTYFKHADLRISIGIQTFDDEILQKAGRDINNAKGLVEEAIKIARESGFRVSGDFMFNLPDRSSFDYIKKDLEKAIELGLEHICWYNLVLNESINTSWSKDKEILNTLPDSKISLENWKQLYDLLIKNNYEPVTVTDFRLKNCPESRYQYEEDLRTPEKIDWIGIGSYAISVLIDKSFKKAVKMINPTELDKYLDKIRLNQIGWHTRFDLKEDDLKLYWITRQIKGTKISISDYQKLFKRDIRQDFKNELTALESKKLINIKDDYIYLTVEGFYYADTVAGHFAWMRVNELATRRYLGKVVKKTLFGHSRYRNECDVWYNDSAIHYMG
ncbi:MAG: radical SAM protein [Candidatus Cloacimonetes bacterium]|nr:radical SAM protein [Candidatus Cloacimonadota bacterium]